MDTVGRVPRSGPADGPRSGPAEAPFHSIESAQEFLALLGETIDEALDEVQQELAACTMRQQQRQVDAWRIVLFTTTKLAANIAASRRLLNDLRMLRNLLHRNIPASASHPHPAPWARPST
jgi:hypothetical protein